MQQYAKISAQIVSTLEALKERGDIIDFKYENHFQYDDVALYILGDKKNISSINNSLCVSILRATAGSNLSVNILYNYFEDGVLYDAEYLQGLDEIKRGYSVSEFEQFAERSELEEDFYDLTSRGSET